MVNAMAPNAPIGAARTMMRMMPKNILAAASTHRIDLLADRAEPRDHKTAQNGHQQDLQDIAASQRAEEACPG